VRTGPAVGRVIVYVGGLDKTGGPSLTVPILNRAVVYFISIAAIILLESLTESNFPYFPEVQSHIK
jgi:hypothetical protein